MAPPVLEQEQKLKGELMLEQKQEKLMLRPGRSGMKQLKQLQERVL
jgi:hypothetical protein